MIRLFAQDAQPRAFDRARKVIIAAAKGGDPTEHLERVKPLFFSSVRDVAQLEETIAQKVADAGGYPLHLG